MFSEVSERSDRTDIQSEDSRQLLQDEAQRSLSVTVKEPLPLSQKTETFGPVYGPRKDSDNDFFRNRQDNVSRYDYKFNDDKYKGTKLNIQNLRDDLADKVFQGFGRVQSSDKSWRLDYVDPSACNTRARVGICFKIKR